MRGHHALVDIQARVSDEILEQAGFAKGVMTLVDEAAQRRVLSAVSDLPINRCAGGSAGNTAMGIADFGGKVAYAGKVGDDALGEFCVADMGAYGSLGESCLLSVPGCQFTRTND